MPLTNELLSRIRERAADYDRNNEYFTEDLADLKSTDYFRLFVPKEHGGLGYTLPELVDTQIALSGASGSTALSVNMHHIWMGVARTVNQTRPGTLDWIFADALAGEVYGFGISEPGNDLVLLGSNSEARPDGQGGYTFHGVKIFTSNGPGWSRLGTFGLDDSDPDDPRNVYAVISRDAGGFEIKDDWDTLGMRASQSNTTILDGAPAPSERVLARLVPGPNSDPLIFGIFANFEVLVSSVYLGIARRSLDLAIEAVQGRTSKVTGLSYAQDPDVRRKIAEAAMEYDNAYLHLQTIARDVEEGADHGALWFPRLSAVKIAATEAAKSVVDQSVRLAGGSSYFTRNELSRLYRDVAAGIFHPTSDLAVHRSWADVALG